MLHITDTALHTLSTSVGLRITVNTGFTGTITITDSLATQAIVTNPVVGNEFVYHGFTGAITVQSSAAGDITVSQSSSERA